MLQEAKRHTPAAAGMCRKRLVTGNLPYKIVAEIITSYYSTNCELFAIHWAKGALCRLPKP